MDLLDTDIKHDCFNGKLVFNIGCGHNYFIYLNEHFSYFINNEKMAKEKGRIKEIDAGIRKAYKEVIKRNWEGIQQYLDEYEITGDCLIVTFLIEGGPQIHMEIEGIDFIENYDGSPDNWAEIRIPLSDDMTREKLQKYDVVGESKLPAPKGAGVFSVVSTFLRRVSLRCSAGVTDSYPCQCLLANYHNSSRA